MSVDRRRAAMVLLIGWIGVAGLARGQQGDPTVPTPADRLPDHTPRAFALTNARIVTGVPDKADKARSAVIERGTIVVRDGVIASVGADVATPGDVRVIDLSGRSVYAGLIDAYSEVDLAPPSDGSRYWNDRVTPELRVADHYQVDRGLNGKLRGQGIVLRLAAPSRGIIKGVSAVVTTGDDPAGAIVKREAALHVQLWSARGGSREQYPNSPMGVVALARQAMYDADWHAKATASAQRAKTAPPPANDALTALADSRRRKLPVVIDSPHELALLRADAFAGEFGLNMIARGSGREYRRLDEVLATKRAVIVPVDFAKPPNVATPEAAMEVSLQRLMHWDHGPENPGRIAAKAGGRMALTAHGLSDAGQFLSQVRKAVKRGLDEEAALRSLTTVPAKLLGVQERFGTIEPGKSASFVVTDGGLFDDKTKVVETWVAGVRHELKRDAVVDPRGQWKATLQRPGGEAVSVTLVIEGESAGEKLKGRFVLAGDAKAKPKESAGEEQEKAPPKDADDAEHAAPTVKEVKEKDPADATGGKGAPGEEDPQKKKAPEKDAPQKDPDSQAPKKDTDAAKDADKVSEGEQQKKAPAGDTAKSDETSVSLDKLSLDGARLTATFKSQAFEQPGVATLGLTFTANAAGQGVLMGQVAWPDGRVGWCTAKLVVGVPPSQGRRPWAWGDREKQEQADEQKDKQADEKQRRRALFAVNHPLGAFGREQAPAAGDVVFVNATVWTCGDAGVIARGYVWVRDGTIVEVGRDARGLGRRT